MSTDILAEENSPTSTSQTIRKIYELLESHTGHDFSDYKINTINRRIENQMQRHHINTIEDYIQLLRNDSQFINKLFEDLLIGVTSFFRDNMAFEALQTALTLKLSAHPANEDTFRVWIPGCSTGEEAYTLAILILECIANLKLKLRVQIFATDIDNNALDVGRAATYHKSEVSNLTEERLNNFFISANDHYKLKKEVRELITFGFQNIILDPPFTKLDLICCRNLLIYFNTDLQKKLFRVFHYSLKSKGLLFLGSSEAIIDHNELFDLTNKDWKIYERNDTATNSVFMLNYPAMKRYPALSSNISPDKPDLDSSNHEELQSKNEELLSTIEEIETSKEEVQSLNEELINVNSELQTRIDLSASVSEDLNNLFNSTQLIAVFLDNSLCIKLFTPHIDEIMHLRPQDIGRPWNHFANNLKYAEFEQNFKAVISETKEMSFEVSAFNDKWFQVRIMPYKTLMNTNDGVVITFNEITEHKTCLQKLQESHDILEEVLHMILFTKEGNV